MSSYRVDFAALPWQTPMEGLRFKARKQDGRQLRLVEYTRDMEPHWCEKGHIGVVLEGRFEIRFDRESVIYGPGDGVFLPPGKEHRHIGRVLTDVVRCVFVEDVAPEPSPPGPLTPWPPLAPSPRQTRPPPGRGGRCEENVPLRPPGKGGGVPSPGWGAGLSGRGDRGVRAPGGGFPARVPRPRLERTFTTGC